ncbi:MAG TPA: BLUF domain-containing protein [Ramlibacter sp.]|nr:BLUF domain-containing protein [Ramlibacter sp.]
MDLTSYFASVDPNAAVARVMCASQASFEGSVYTELDRIRASASRHNEPAGVYTAILYQSGWFVQWQEGPAPALLATMERVARDARHHSMRVVHASRGPRLLDGSWSTAVVQTDESADDVADRVAHLRHALHQGRQYSPPSAWGFVSTPAFLPGARQQAASDAYQRVLLCSASGTGSFDFVRWLADQHGQEVVHRRYAGARDLDVGADFVDIAQDASLLRVVAMARRGLALPLTRAFLSDYSHLVVLLSDDAERNEALMRRLAQACQLLPAAPTVVGVSARADMHGVVAAQAQRLRLDYVPVRADPRVRGFAWAALREQLAHWGPSERGWGALDDVAVARPIAAPAAPPFLALSIQ